MTKYIIYSPDHITIDFENAYYTSKKKAMDAFEKWKQRYERQGYYSSNDYGRIPLESLQSYCTFIIRKP